MIDAHRLGRGRRQVVHHARRRRRRRRPRAARFDGGHVRWGRHGRPLGRLGVARGGDRRAHWVLERAGECVRLSAPFHGRVEGGEGGNGAGGGGDGTGALERMRPCVRVWRHGCHVLAGERRLSMPSGAAIGQPAGVDRLLVRRGR